MRWLRAGKIKGEGYHRCLLRAGGKKPAQDQEQEQNKKTPSTRFVRSHAEEIMPKTVEGWVRGPASSAHGPLPGERCVGMQVADGNGQGVGGIGWFWYLAEFK